MSEQGSMQGAEKAGNVTSLDRHRGRGDWMPADEAPVIEMFMDDDRIIFRDQAALDEYVKAACACGHAAIDHHGIDPADGCLGVVSHRLPQCPCRQTCSAVLADVRRYATLTLDSISVERRGMAEDVLSIIDQPEERP